MPVALPRSPGNAGNLEQAVNTNQAEILLRDSGEYNTMTRDRHRQAGRQAVNKPELQR
jgi:hypothetical protein